VTNIRRDFTRLSDGEKQQVIDAFTLAKLVPSMIQPTLSVFDYFAAMYYWSMPHVPHIDIIAHPLLNGTSFNYNGDGTNLLWIRRFVRGMERELQRILADPTFTLPYWNWTTSLANDNDDVLRWFGGDGDSKSTEPRSCRRTDQNGFNGADCVVTRGEYASWPLIGLWGNRYDSLAIDARNDLVSMMTVVCCSNR
jgi:hypothetical protein